MSYPRGIVPGMETPHGTTFADQLSRNPVITDADVLARVELIIDPEARRDRALWLFFLNPDGTQPNVIMPIDDIPEFPDMIEDGEYLFQMLSHICGPDVPDCRVVITLTRDGRPDLTDSDRCWLQLFQWGVPEYAVPVRMLCLATPEGIRELGPFAA